MLVAGQGERHLWACGFHVITGRFLCLGQHPRGARAIFDLIFGFGGPPCMISTAVTYFNGRGTERLAAAGLSKAASASILGTVT